MGTQNPPLLFCNFCESIIIFKRFCKQYIYSKVITFLIIILQFAIIYILEIIYNPPGGNSKCYATASQLWQLKTGPDFTP